MPTRSRSRCCGISWRCCVGRCPGRGIRRRIGCCWPFWRGWRGADGEHGGALYRAEPLRTALDGSVLLPCLRRPPHIRWSAAVRRPRSHNGAQRCCTYFNGALGSLMGECVQVNAVTAGVGGWSLRGSRFGSRCPKWSALLSNRRCPDEAAFDRGGDQVRSGRLTSSRLSKWSSLPWCSADATATLTLLHKGHARIVIRSTAEVRVLEFWAW